MKNTQAQPITKVYLATSFFNDQQKARVTKALEVLETNATVGVVHQPFDFQYKDALIDHDPEGVFGNLEWQVATYNNDVNAVGNSDVCVALYDMDQEDVGIAFEFGMFVALHKPIILLPFSQKPAEDYEVNLMLARGVSTWLQPNDFDQLADFNFNHPMAQPNVPYPVI